MRDYYVSAVIIVVLLVLAFAMIPPEQPSNYIIVDGGGVTHALENVVCHEGFGQSGGMFGGTRTRDVICRDSTGDIVFSANFESIQEIK